MKKTFPVQHVADCVCGVRLDHWTALGDPPHAGPIMPFDLGVRKKFRAECFFCHKITVARCTIIKTVIDPKRNIRGERYEIVYEVLINELKEVKVTKDTADDILDLIKKMGAKKLILEKPEFKKWSDEMYKPTFKKWGDDNMWQKNK